MKNAGLIVGMLSCAVMFSGCAMFRMSTSEVDLTKDEHMKSTYDYRDLIKITESISKKVMEDDFIAKQAESPMMMFAGIENRTQQHADTKTLAEKIRSQLFNAKKARFINESRRDELMKEQGFQAANATPETQTKIGKQLGAKYMITGSLTEMESTSGRQVRVSKQQINYYKLTIEITDLETSEIVCTKDEEFARQASQPLVGW